MTDLLWTTEGCIGRITINRPEQRNALSPVVLAEMRRLIDAAANDRAIRILTITGAGDRVFCAGADLKTVLPAGEEDNRFRRGEFRQLLLDIHDCPKPTVALARGHVLAGGIGILLACDLALACDDIDFSTPEIKVGMFPMMVLALLYRHVGRKRANEMMLLGEPLPAAMAVQEGIVNRIFARDQFEAQTAEFLRTLSEMSPGIVRMGKKAISYIEDSALPQQLEYLESCLGEVMASEDSKEGIRAFVEKRKPRWKDL